MREIVEILQKARAHQNGSKALNGFYITGISTGDHGSEDSTTSVTIGFRGFSIEFHQTKWMVNSDDTLHVWLRVTGIDGIDISMVNSWANEVVEAMKQSLLKDQLRNAIIKQVDPKSD